MNRPRRTAAGLALLSCALLVGAWGMPGASASALPSAVVTPTATVASSAFAKTVTVARTHLVDGKDVTVDKRTVTLRVNVTKDLRDRQGIDVSWSGARPTGGILADTHSGAAGQEEYPMVLLQCRGVDSTSVVAAKRISPQTCWTGTPVERYTSSYAPAFPAWRVDRYATAAERTHNPGTPNPRPAQCFSEPPTERWLPFLAADGKSYPGGPLGCAGQPPEASKLDSTTALPSNTTYAVTGLDGTGFSRFDVRDSINNGSLGCSASVPCTLVAIPIMGISCDVAASSLPATDVPTGADATDAATECMRTGHFKPGALIPGAVGDNDRAVSGELWWSASNWRNRISVPITMAPSLAACSASTAVSADIYGSEVLVQATSAWIPKFCLNSKAVPVKHVQTGEPQARNLLGSSSIEAAFTSRARDGGYSRAAVHAPVAVSGFAITYTIDDEHGDRYDKLKLSPRLIAKLLTQSYPAIPAIKDGYAALSDNPLDMSLDPEFIALNPGIKKGVAAGTSASTIYSISSDSDVIYALSAYLNADPETRAWLDGAPDPWGMKVNPNYLRMTLPVDSWPLLDTFEPTALYETGNNACLLDAPVPYLPLVASPTSRLVNISLAMQYSLANSQVVCVQPFAGSSVGQKLTALGRQSGGFRFMLGLASLGDAARFGLDSASLQTNVSSGSGSKFTSAAGRTFVAPSEAGLRKAAALLTTATSPVDWQLPYATVVGDPKGAAAYPGTMVIYADVPTSGLAAHDAKGFAAFLAYVAHAGQQPGQAIGQLPPGFLPMTKANGLGALADYTTRSAQAVSDQSGTVPPLVAPPVTPSTPIPAPATGGAGTTTGGEGTTGGSTPTSATTPTPTPAPTPSTTSPATVAAAAKTPAVDAGVAGLALPGLLVVVVLGLLLAGFTLLTSREPA
jgi:hypothetical protein